jgi:hypothetical protein
VVAPSYSGRFHSFCEAGGYASVAVLLVMMMPSVADAQKNTSASKDTTAAKKKKAAEFARGKGTVGSKSFSFNVIEDNNPATDRASGTFTLKAGGEFANGKLTCLLTATNSGKLATFAGKVTKSNALPVGTPLLFVASDESSGDKSRRNVRDAWRDMAWPKTPDRVRATKPLFAKDTPATLRQEAGVSVGPVTVSGDALRRPRVSPNRADQSPL